MEPTLGTSKVAAMMCKEFGSSLTPVQLLSDPLEFA
jgi:hypothetical protein